MNSPGKDFRQRAVAAYQSGEFTREEVAKMFGYTTSTIGHWMRTVNSNCKCTGEGLVKNLGGSLVV